MMEFDAAVKDRDAYKNMEAEPLIDEDAYHDVVGEAAKDLTFDLFTYCTWSTLGEEAFNKKLKLFYQDEVADLVRSHEVIRAGRFEREFMDLFNDVVMSLMDELGRRKNRILRRARRILLDHAEHIQIRVRRNQIEIVDLLYDNDRAGSHSHLSKKAFRNE